MGRRRASGSWRQALAGVAQAGAAQAEAAQTGAAQAEAAQGEAAWAGAAQAEAAQVETAQAEVAQVEAAQAGAAQVEAAEVMAAQAEAAQAAGAQCDRAATTPGSAGSVQASRVWWVPRCEGRAPGWGRHVHKDLGQAGRRACQWEKEYAVAAGACGGKAGDRRHEVVSAMAEGGWWWPGHRRWQQRVKCWGR